MRKKLKTRLVLVLSIMICLLSFPVLKEIVLKQKHHKSNAIRQESPGIQIQYDKADMQEELFTLFEVYNLEPIKLQSFTTV